MRQHNNSFETVLNHKKKKQSISSNIFALAVTMIVSTSFVLSYYSWHETQNSSTFILLMQQQQSEINEKLTQIMQQKTYLENIKSDIQGDLNNYITKVEYQDEKQRNLDRQKYFNDLSQKHDSQIIELQKNNVRIFEDISTFHQLPVSLSVLQNDFKYLSELKPDVESIKYKLMDAQVDIQVTRSQINYNSKIIDQVVSNVDVLEKDQRNILIRESSLISQVDSIQNRIDQIVQKLVALDQEQSSILSNQNNLNSQFNQISNKIDQLTTIVDVVPKLSEKVDSLGLDVPAIQDSINSLKIKINSDTFNKVELFGPYYPIQHSISMTVTNSGYTLFQTVQPCIISIKGKAVVTLIATGHSVISSNSGQISFMINRKVNLPITNLEKWQLGAQYTMYDWNPVNLTQEFMLEVGVYEFTLGGFYPYSGSATLSMNAVSFVAKVTYIS